MLHKLNKLRYCVFWPGGWDDIGFTERPIWASSEGYGYIMDDEPCSFYVIKDLDVAGELKKELLSKIDNNELTFDDIERTPLIEIPVVYENISDECLDNYLWFVKYILMHDKDCFFCSSTYDGLELFDTEAEMIGTLENRACFDNGGIKWAEMKNNELEAWCERLFGGGKNDTMETSYILPISLSILKD